VRIAAICLAVVGLGGIIVLVVADASASHSNAMGPLAFLCCIVGVVLMILLGVTLGGRGRQRQDGMSESTEHAAEVTGEGRS